MPACDECNGGTSTADLTAAVVSRWDYNSPPQERSDHARLAAQVWRQAPELIAEWTKTMSPNCPSSEFLRNGIVRCRLQGLEGKAEGLGAPL